MFEDLGPPLLEVRMPPRGFTTAELLEMPEYQYRVELTGGALAVLPSPSWDHQLMSGRLFARLHGAERNGRRINGACDVHLSERTTRIVDLLILRAGVRCDRETHYLGEELEVAIEIESSESTVLDRKLKPLIYAEYGIPHYWRVELEPELIAVVFRLENNAYAEVSRGPRIDVTEPFPFAVDLAELMED